MYTNVAIINTADHSYVLPQQDIKAIQFVAEYTLNQNVTCHENITTISRAFFQNHKKHYVHFVKMRSLEAAQMIQETKEKIKTWSNN